jgi:hypothetical protein
MTVFMETVGAHYCVSHAHPGDVERAHKYGQSVMLDNGAFSKWKTGKQTDWNKYYDWCDEWLDCPTTWAVVPDEIEGGEDIQDELIRQWPFGQRGSPVWHMHEPIDRALRLVDEWPKVCFGSSGEYETVGSPDWFRRMEEVFDALEKRHKRTPWIHMMRGMQCVKWGLPFASVDSADVARNHHARFGGASPMIRRWDGMQCPPRMIRQVSMLSADAD